jgi:hypothetical protein
MSVLRCAILIALVFEGPTLSAAKEVLRSYSNAEYNYRLAFPTSWHISVVPVKAGPVLYNYSPSFAMGQGLFPPGGAEISVLPLASFEGRMRNRTEQEWIAEDVRGLAYGKPIIENISDVGNPHITDLVRVSYDHERIPDEELQRYVMFYFRLGGEPFVLGLNYWKEDSRAAVYEKTLISILRSIRHVSAKPN